MLRGVRMKDVVLSQAAIALAVLEEREEVEEGERGGKEGEEKGEEEGEDGRREEGDVNEEKGAYPTAHREFLERIKENQVKLEEAMALLVVETFGLSRLRFVKAEAWTVIFSERRLPQMLNNALTLRACCVTLEYARN
ncbi:uncharacterized protein MONOS_13588 [Monocercomonoides exilis]|uniref:uncharacterized protein n=1 Tax=Monocercomonoides exilis TaxID=2049356 RepID=UPI00355A65F4|nr:hypothetical protein MONOS_13588 [Monocercomonoides exilis]|eukprot:MONOS_13588.1-p1 / transcript=MONOS_13588.1 / gene=MONOS_13588 / organism=Monocercomonoides_exilis_PA203 / gene_product=unspecified product / transcript_product=unspecified product / location=Mono_scaffold00850:9591-10004(-) / protein_length=138 / sequence_SO=supercontig / SO=protein_coding / is_pseudo=false